MDKTLVFIDNGYLSKISKHFGNGKHVPIDINQFAITLAKKQNLWVDSVFLYVAPPFKNDPPTAEEVDREARYTNFISKVKRIPNFNVREGRLQKIDNVFKQKGVDTLLTMDLFTEPFSRNIKTIILLACDTDFVPVLNHIRSKGIKVILYYFSDFVRRSVFSMSNHILTACDNCVLLDKTYFDKSLYVVHGTRQE